MRKMPEDKVHKITSVTCTAPVNIAVIKYWGKRDEDLILPINSSLSVTLDQDQLKTTTTAACSRSFKEDRIWLNGKEEDINQPRLQSCLRELRRLARKRRSDGDSSTDVLSYSHKIHICSVNNFPTAAGLASSAAGYACLVYTLSQLLGVEGELSEVARQGSGSACRSMYGGFVQWRMGEQEDGKDSVAEQVEAESHWQELRVLILVVSAERKPVGSTAGMQTSVETSPLLKHRADSLVPGRMEDMINAIRQCDFAAFGELTMKAIVAYTFDAGPNAVIYTLQQHMAEFLQVVMQFFPPETNGGQFLKGLPVSPVTLSEELKSSIGMDPLPKGIRYIISTKPGPGPRLVDDPSLHLLGPDGLPKKTA
ncbi:hypothetical protein AAFF_G00269780 [Aldrovandia affinis]|uniref:Diphosphomevalonate decarboxylase n=1 Tax=Aldrovandia affinis TaxID=143900 RepID=A0AAD7SSC3_9TELE|nr:hypothetical protein AAFF_G00269780 [Aldrovandia affinis]